MTAQSLADLICELSSQVHLTHAAILAGGSRVPFSDSPALIAAGYPRHVPGHAAELARLPEMYRMVVMGLASLQGAPMCASHERRLVAYSIHCLDGLLAALLAALVKDGLTARQPMRSAPPPRG